MNAATWHSGGNSNRWKSCHLNDIEGKQVKWNVALRRHFPSRWKRRRNLFLFSFAAGTPRCHVATPHTKKKTRNSGRKSTQPATSFHQTFPLFNSTTIGTFQVKQPPSPPGGTYANEVRRFLFFNVNFIEREIGASTNGSLPPLMSSSWIFNERPLPPAAGFTGRPPGSLFKDFPQFPFFLISI